MSRICRVTARQIFDSRANPTLEVDVVLQSGAMGRGMVPSGASTGRFEALELRDGDPAHFGGKGVLKALDNVRSLLAPRLLGMDACDQAGVDALLRDIDGTPDKSRCGANAVLACSLATAQAAAKARGLPLYRHLGGGSRPVLPVPMIQIIGGGAHAPGSTDIQDFLVIPLSATSFAQAMEMVINAYAAARRIFQELGRPLSAADEGGLWPTGFADNEEGLRLLTRSIEAAGYAPLQDMGIALDVAASEFYDAAHGRYALNLEGRTLEREAFVDTLCDWVDRYPIVSLEDACAEDDWEGHAMVSQRLGQRIQLIGDDLFTTNVERIRRGVQHGVCNAVLIKMNQIGTVSETLEAVSYTQSHGYLPVISARSGETEDAAIAHLAVAVNAGQLKVGSVTRAERTAKWNEVLRLEEALGEHAVYPQAHGMLRLSRGGGVAG